MKNKPDSYSRHEALHMASFFMNAIDRELKEHDYVKSEQDCLALAEKAHQALFDLYQLIGAKHLNDSENG